MTDLRSSASDPASASLRLGRHGRQTRRRPRFALRPLALALAAGSLLSLPGVDSRAQAVPGVPVLPTGLTVIQGQVKAVTTGQNLTVTNSAGSILNWQSFSIGQNNGVTFVQPSAQSQVLNRVVGNDPSAILGSLSSNGRVWLLNPNGVLFGHGARIDVGGLVTSTLNLNDVDWLKGQTSGRFNLFGDSGASIVNQGELRSSLGGHIALLGGSVRNEGLIEAPGGQVLLAAGKSIELIDTGSPNLRLKVTAPDGEALNLGTLKAAGGRIDVHAAVVNQQGIVRADSLSTNAAGEIVLSASQALNLGKDSLTSASGATGGRVSLDSGEVGTTLVHGEVLATGSQGTGGNVTLLGKNVGVVDQARIDASGASGGGQIHVGGGERGQDPSLRNADGVYIGAGTSLTADATDKGDGGRIVLWGNEATRAYGAFSARGGPSGGNGGFIETSGHWIDVNPARLDASAPAGLAGTWLLDPYNITIVNAADPPTGSGYALTSPPFTFTSNANNAVVPSALIRSALNGGNSVVIATGAGGTQAGDISATGVDLAVSPTTPVSLTLQAHRNINFSGGTISTDNAALSVLMQAGTSGTGRVSLTSPLAITTRGGSIDLRGTGFQSTDPSTAYGVFLSGAVLDAGAGGITLNGGSTTATSFARGVYLSRSTLTAGSIGATGSTNNTGTGSGAGVDLSFSTLTAGTITLSGTALGSSGFSTGVGISGSTLTANRALTITGNSIGSGVLIGGTGSVLQVTPASVDPAAAISISGNSTWINFDGSYVNYGVDISGQYGGTLRATNGARIDVTGVNNPGGLPSLRLDSALPVDAVTGGNVSFTGNRTASISARIDAGGTVRVFGDQVTIVSGSVVRSRSPGGDALVVAGVNSPNTTQFSNAAGAGAFVTEAGARWLVYGQNVASVAAGGLPYAFKQYNARFGEPNALTPTTGNGLLYAIAPVVTIGANPVSKVYDGTLAAGALTGLSFSGQLDNDRPIGTVTGSFLDKDAGLNKPVAIDAASVSFADSLNRPVLGYTLTSNVRGDLLRKTVTLGGVSAANKVYDGNTAASVTVGSLNGLVGSETLVATASGNFDTKDVGVNKTVSVSASLANGGNGGLASNYLLNPSTATTTANITPRPLVFGSITAADKVYDGNTVASVSLGPLVGLVGSETLISSAIGSFNTKDAGFGKPVSVSVTVGNGSNGGLVGNYTLPTATSTTASITAAALTVRANDAAKTFGTTLTFAGTEFTTGGLISGETVGSVTLTSTGAPASASVAGGPYPIVASNAIGGSFSPGNYTITYVNGRLTVTPADLRAVLVNIVGNPTKVYDGNDVATLGTTNYGFTGFVGSDSATVNQTTGRYDSPNAGSRTVSATLAAGNFSPVGSTDLNNYTLPTTASGPGTIVPKPLVLAGLTANNKTYDGTVAATLSNAGTLTGLVGSQTLGVNSSGARFDTKDAGAGKTVTVEALSLANGSGLASNYVIAPSAVTTADIMPKTVTAASLSAANKLYDGNTLASVTLGPLAGLVGSETLGTGASGNFDTKDVGTAKTVTVSGVLSNGANGGLASNYRLAPAATTADITPRTVTAGTVSAANKVYDGNTVASVNVAGLSGLVGSETLVLSSSGNFDTQNAGSGKTVTLTAALGNGANGGLAGNYRLAALPTTTADITPKAVSLSGVSAASKVYDGNTVASVTLGSLNGLVGSETLGLSSGSAQFDTKDAGIAKTVTVAGLGLTNASGLASNYRLTATTATTTADLTPRLLTLGPIGAADKVYDGTTVASVTLGALGNLVGSETLSASASGSFDTKDVGSNKPVSAVVGIANGTNGGLAANYRLSTPIAPARAAITPATLTYSASPARKLVGAPLPALSGSVSGFVAGESQASVTTGSLLFTTPALAGSPAGFYAIDGSGLSAGNYRFTQAAGNATALTVTGLDPQQTDQGSKAALSQTLALVAPPSAWSSPSDGRVLDVFQVLRGNFLSQGSLFRSIPVGDLSQESLTTLLTARDRYKKSLFAEAIRRLEQDPTLADAPPCPSTKEVDNGTCLITEDLKRPLRRDYEALQLASGQVPSQSPAAAPPVPTPSAAPTPGQPAPAPAPAPAPSAPVAAAAPPVAVQLPLLRRRVRSASLPQIERKIAVVIGIDQYADKNMPKLDNAVGDARAIGQLLEATLGYETVVLPNATKQTVIRTLNRLAIEAGPRDSVVVYYAGHGELVPATGLGYWQLADSEAKRPETWMSNADISRLVKEIGASQVALISDSCYSGSLVDERIRGAASSVDPQQLLNRKTVVVMSSGGNEPVFDEGKRGHSPFAFSLMNNLRQVANWQVGGNVFERVRFAVARELPQRPNYGSAQSAGHQAGGDYLFEQRQLDSSQ